ncbi:superoxide dismutase, partial [Mycobacterium sp. ITM-2017-0098]
MLRSAAAAALFAVPALVLSACSPPGEVPSDTPGTTPSVWTGSPSPSAGPEEQGSAGSGSGEAAGQTLKADLKLPDGTTVATAEIAFSGDHATVTVQTTAAGELAPGFHGIHIHSVGRCEANSVAPTGGAPANF